jgi:hypothetical protein
MKFGNSMGKGMCGVESKFSSRIEGALSQFFREVGIDVRSRMGRGGGRGYVMMG